jgi:hypothetical protein
VRVALLALGLTYLRFGTDDSTVPGPAGAEAGDLIRGASGSVSRAFAATTCLLHVSREKARLVREHDCLDTVAEVELLEDVRDVRLDGRVADVQFLADLRVGEWSGRAEAHH